MKKKSVIVFIAIACVSLTACGNKQPAADSATATTEVTTETETEETSSEVENEEASSMPIDEGNTAEYIVTVDMTDASQEIKSEEDVLLLKVTASFPDVTIDGSAEAADNINDFYAKEKESFDAAVKENETFAKEDYAARSKEEQANFFNYEMMQSYTAKRTDDASISIISDTYQMTGGAHGNAVRTGATFDTASGQQLTFKDVFTDVDKAKEFINQYLLEEFKTDKYKDMLFEDYEKDVPTILDDNTWYLSDEGFVVICNEYIVSPHSSGIMEVTIPYADFTELSDMYKPAAK